MEQQTEKSRIPIFNILLLTAIVAVVLFVPVIGEQSETTENGVVTKSSSKKQNLFQFIKSKL